MADLCRLLSDATAQIFERLGFNSKHAAVRRSDRPDIADFQCNGALAIAREVGRKPIEIAASIAHAWVATDLADKPLVAGPGFLNYRVCDDALSRRTQQIVEDEHCGASTVSHKRRVLLDYGGPNVAKPMHVGHLRASIIGESLKRIFRLRGDEVWGDVHFGDGGFQMGLLIVALEDELGGFGDTGRLEARLQNLTLEDLDRLYPTAAALAKTDDTFRDRARKATLVLQSGDALQRNIWRAMRDVSMVALKREFAALGIAFDLWNGESDADPYIPVVLEDLHKRHLIESDRGAQIVRVARPGTSASSRRC